MKRVSLFLLPVIFLLSIFDAKGGEGVGTWHLVLRWTREGLKTYELKDPEDAKFVAEEARFRGEKVMVLKGELKDLYLSCAMGFFISENHPRINLNLLLRDIKQRCRRCKPINCEIVREEALNFLERAGARDIASDLKESYRRAEQ